MHPSNIMEYCQVFLFGDLTIPFEEDLRQLLHTKGNGSLSSFFDQVGFAFREEFGKLASRQQYLLPSFTTLIDLLFKLEESKGAPALKFALLCLYQIGQFIRYELQALISYFLNLKLIGTIQILWRRIKTLPQC